MKVEIVSTAKINKKCNACLFAFMFIFVCLQIVLLPLLLLLHSITGSIRSQPPPTDLEHHIHKKSYLPGLWEGIVTGYGKALPSFLLTGSKVTHKVKQNTKLILLQLSLKHQH